MKKTVFLILVISVLFQTEGFSQNKKNEFKSKPDTLKVDSLEYKLVVLDPGFNSWLVTQPPENFYSKSYYEIKNRNYVLEWNQRYMTGPHSGLYDNYIYYDQNKDYGLELNYKLYYFFKYFEKTTGVSLGPGD